MFRLDVFTEIGTFTVHENEVANVQEIVPDVTKLVNDLEAGAFFLGYPPDLERDKEAVMFSISDKSVIKAYILYPYKPVTDLRIEEPTASLEEEDVVTPFTARLEYLGNAITVKGLKLLHDGIYYVLPVEVNGEPHTERIKQKALDALLQAWLEEVKGLDRTQYLTLIPDVPMSFSLSADYLRKYIDGMYKERVGSNAKAWTAWNDKEA